jgi:hypothetical protein
MAMAVPAHGGGRRRDRRRRRCGGMERAVRSDAHCRAERGGAGRHLPAGTRAQGLANPVPQCLPQRWRHPQCSCCAVEQCAQWPARRSRVCLFDWVGAGERKHGAARLRSL